MRALRAFLIALVAVSSAITFSGVAVRPAAAQSATRKIIAVFDIESSGVRLNEGALEGLNVYLTTKIAGGGYQVVPRDQLRTRLRQQKSESYKSCYDQSCQIEIGKELAAQKSLSSKILRLGKQCIVTLALYDLRTNASERAADATGGCAVGELVRSIENATQKLVLPAGGPTPSPALLGVVDKQYCPKPGARRQGSPPPDGTYIWCANNKGLRDGAAIYWHPNGKRMMEGLYRDNKQEGTWIQWHRNGKKRSETLYRAGKKTGRYVEWDTHGKQSEQGQYKDDKKTGVWTRWISGALYSKTTHVNDDMHGPHTVWDSDGTKRYEGSYRHGERAGLWTFYSDGKKVSRGPYSNDQRNGIWVQFDKRTGEKSAHGPYKDDKQHGVWTRYSRGGRETQTYHQGQLHGPHASYNGDQLIEQGHYRNGKRHGVWTRWSSHREGRYKLREETYKEGRLHGRSIRYHSSGNPSTVEHYADGRREGRYEQYDRDGAKREVGTYRDNQREGRWLYYRSNGSVREVIYERNKPVREAQR